MEQKYSFQQMVLGQLDIHMQKEEEEGEEEEGEGEGQGEGVGQEHVKV